MAVGVNVDQAQKANDSDIAGRILAEFLRRAEAGIRAALDEKDLVTAPSWSTEGCTA